MKSSGLPSSLHGSLYRVRYEAKLFLKYNGSGTPINSFAPKVAKPIIIPVIVMPNKINSVMNMNKLKYKEHP